MNCCANWKSRARSRRIGREPSILRVTCAASPRSWFRGRLADSRAGLEETAAALAARRGFLLEHLQIAEVGHAVRAADRVEMKVDVILLALIEHLHQIAAQLFASGT